MTSSNRVWDNSTQSIQLADDGYLASSADDGHEPAPDGRAARSKLFEHILGRLDTGIAILEPSRHNDPTSLEITYANERAVNFFGQTSDSTSELSTDEILTEAHN